MPAALLLALSLSSTSLATALPPAPEFTLPDDFDTSYQIEVTADPAAQRLQGRERITWRNATETAADELRLHLYLNAFRDEHSSFLREAHRRQGRFGPRFGAIVIDRLSVIDRATGAAADRTAALRPIAPDDGNARDATVVTLPLEVPLAPHETITLELEFTVSLPGIWSRSGQSGNFLAIAQWFPKLGVFEAPEGDPARAAVWNCAQYHHATEYYAHHARYEVQLDLPAEYSGKVAATGALVEERRAGERVHQRWRADGVIDFAWFADPDFVVVRQRLDGEGIRRDGVEVVLYLQPDHVGLAPRHFAPIEYGLRWFGRAFGPYPYPVLHAVDPQHDSRAADGMEYPTLITCDARRLAPRRMATPESTTLHEVGHQYFYGLVSSDEVEHPFLDEGLNSFCEKQALAEWFGPEATASGFGPFYSEGAPLAWIDQTPPGLGPLGAIGSGRALGFERGRLASWWAELPPLTATPWTTTAPWQRREDWLPHAGKQSVWGASWHSATRDVLRAHAYSMTALTLESYRRARGDVAALAGLREYVRGAAFGVGRPQALLDAFARAARDLPAGPLPIEPLPHLRQLLRTPGWVDFSADSLECSAMPGTDRFVCRAVINRDGAFVLPVEFELEFADGRRERRLWDGTGGQHLVTFETDSPVVALRVDPERRWVFDRDLSNNGLRSAPRTEAWWRVLLALTHQLLQRLVTFGAWT